jgi:hypothetical protein
MRGHGSSMRATRLIAVTVLALPIFWGGTAKGEVFANPGFYTVNVDGWTRSTLPEGFIYRCTICKEQVDIKIEYGPPLGPDAPWKTNDQFIASVSTEKAQKDFADELLKGSLPTNKRIKIEVTRVGLSDVGGLRVLRIATQVSMGSSVIPDTWMIAVHRSRMLWCVVHFSVGAMNSDNEKAVNALMDGLVFEK